MVQWRCDSVLLFEMYWPQGCMASRDVIVSCVPRTIFCVLCWKRMCKRWTSHNLDLLVIRIYELSIRIYKTLSSIKFFACLVSVIS